MAVVRQDISGGWQFRQEGESVWRSAIVPGTVHGDLRRHGLIPDPFWGTHEAAVQWVDKVGWEYTTTFDVDPDLRDMPHIALVFMGLDTYADVTLNGTKVLAADNMFRTWRTEITERLRPTGNTLSVRLRSPVAEDLPKLEALGYALPAVNDQSERGGLGDQKVSVFARKAPYHYGWDWGPRLVTSGIWRPVRLEGWAGVRIDDVYVRTVEATPVEAHVEVAVAVEADQADTARLLIETEGLQHEQPVNLVPGANRITVPLTLTRPRLWWCRGLGRPDLYTFSVRVQSGRGADAATVRTGIRTVRLVQEPDAHGTSFGFELNGVRVFAKGANYIPLDVFLPDVTPERYRDAIATAVASHMNMLRVWGGGVYEDDRFYDLCDEEGVMVWQDFMFACSMYPGDSAFLDNVRREAEDNVRRLRNHPAVVLFCGNNEIDVAWAEGAEGQGWGWKERYPAPVREKIWQDYEAVFHRILPDVVAALAPHVPYWPSSPMQAPTPDRFDPAQTYARGDVHYWALGREPAGTFTAYETHVGRFMSEYGFQSLPNLPTILAFLRPEDLQQESPALGWHQRAGDGGRLMAEFIAHRYPPARDFAAFVRLSQVVQADGVGIAIAAHRRAKPRCLGSLYWQLDDCWPAVSWASRDYFGRWKALQYVVRRRFRDRAVFLAAHEEAVAVDVVSDVRDPFAARVRLASYTVDGRLLHETVRPIHCGPGAAERVLAVRQDTLRQGRAPEDVVILAQLEAAETGEILDERFHYLVEPGRLALADPRITLFREDSPDGTRFTLVAQHFARHVWLEAPDDGVFSDNAFDLLPHRPKTVVFQQRVPGTCRYAPAWTRGVTVESLWNWIQQTTP